MQIQVQLFNVLISILYFGIEQHMCTKVFHLYLYVCACVCTHAYKRVKYGNT